MTTSASPLRSVALDRCFFILRARSAAANPSSEPVVGIQPGRAGRRLRLSRQMSAKQGGAEALAHRPRPGRWLVVDELILYFNRQPQMLDGGGEVAARLGHPGGQHVRGDLHQQAHWVVADHFIAALRRSRCKRRLRRAGIGHVAFGGERHPARELRHRLHRGQRNVWHGVARI